ncbi:fasciclin domain-containing protein [Tsukamurella asaccharolytica]|uniref:Fasciclin domain-containing protein n=1 Tax=Tsukamurella asaccharolytica TaxID=2592067 RepID=A0A5C5RGI4_9ACTN|nr:fasciclin domain-containing protein [Tsukamurella asaccharolytica]TWS21553.1 fasciclin domain-containing protein [Tsukamurella asaccharolytica]
MIDTKFRRGSAAIAAAGLVVGLVAGCSSDSSGDSASATTGMTSATSTQPMSGAMSSPMTSAPAAGASALFGAGCADYAAQNPSGPGSVAGMGAAPVATAASNNPLLTTLTSAISGKLNPKVNLVDTLNGGQFTVFAPTDAAFAKIPAETIEKLKVDDALLTKILTYHVVPGQLAPEQVAGTHKTVEGGEVTVTGTPQSTVKVGDATVVCGGVKTANATVYLIDTVLMPN